MILLLVALFGLIIGSFLNVCIYRVPRDLSVVTPRSFCPECGAQIAAIDNIPIVSFFVLHRRCRMCRAPISFRYPAVEAITAGLFAIVYYRYGIDWITLKWLLFEALMVVLFWTDFEERILPDEFTLGGFALACLLALTFEVPSPLLDLFLGNFARVSRSLSKVGISSAVLAMPIWLIASLYSRLRGREAMGLGDVKLLALLGAFLGLENGVLAVMVASFAGSLTGIFLLVRHRRHALSLELPFGSFLCAGAALMPLWKHLT